MKVVGIVVVVVIGSCVQVNSSKTSGVTSGGASGHVLLIMIGRVPSSIGVWREGGLEVIGCVR